MKEAILYEQLPEKRVLCTACSRYCNIPEGKIGLCGIRANVDGKLQLLVYGKVIAGHVDPIEKKPVTHYMPGSKIFSIATTGCNWLCRYCQNYDISQRRKVEGIDATPEEIVGMAKKYQADGIAYTYNEPTIFIEYAHDIGVIARKEGLINIFVSNGFMTTPAIAMMDRFLDCITVDFKGSGEREFVRKFIGIPSADPIFQNLLEMKSKTNIHIEITDLIVPRVGDSLDAARHLSKWVYDNLGPDMPIHFLRFHPDYKMMDFPLTPIETLVEHHKVAKEVGLNYAYIGNVPGHPLEHTYCPGCKQIVIQRYGYDILDWKMDKDNRCLNCGYKITMVGSLSDSARTIRFHPVSLS